MRPTNLFRRGWSLFGKPHAQEPPELTLEEKLRWALKKGREMGRAEKQPVQYPLNLCQFCGTKLVPVHVGDEDLLGCPNRRDGHHNTGAIPQVGPLSAQPSSRVIAVSRLLHEKDEARKRKTALEEAQARQAALVQRQDLLRSFTSPLLILPPSHFPPPPTEPLPPPAPTTSWEEMLEQFAMKNDSTAKVPAVQMRNRVQARMRMSG